MQWLMVTILHTMPRSSWDLEIGKAEVQITYLGGAGGRDGGAGGGTGEGGGEG